MFLKILFQVVLSNILLMKLILVANAELCVHKDFGYDGTACVCNATFCDTIEPLKKLPIGRYQRYTSTRRGLRFSKSYGNFTDSEEPNYFKVTVISSKRYQKIIGFGGAFSDSAVANINSLHEKAKDRLIRAYFGSEGIDYNLIRIPIGGTDFSMRGYSYDDGPVDLNLTRFNLTSEDYELKLPLIKMVNKIRGTPLKLIASAWTAPKWMKTNNEYWGYGFIKDNMYKAWADYHVKFLDAYKAEGVEFWAITTGNELIDALAGFIRINAVAWFPDGLTKWVADYFGPAIRSSNHSDIVIMALDDQRILLPLFVEPMFRNKKARDFVDGIALHWYLDSISPPVLLQRQHRLYPNKFLLQTEASIGDRPWELDKVKPGSWHRGERYASSISEYLANWVTGWMDWNIVLNMEGGPSYIKNKIDSPVLVDVYKGEFYKSPMFYAIGHFSKFVTPGSIRIKTNYFIPNVDIVAFARPDKAIVVTIINKREEHLPLTISHKKRGFINFEVHRKSFNTIIYW